MNELAHLPLGPHHLLLHACSCVRPLSIDLRFLIFQRRVAGEDKTEQHSGLAAPRQCTKSSQWINGYMSCVPSTRLRLGAQFHCRTQISSYRRGKRGHTVTVQSDSVRCPSLLERHQMTSITNQSGSNETQSVPRNKHGPVHRLHYTVPDQPLWCAPLLAIAPPPPVCHRVVCLRHCRSFSCNFVLQLSAWGCWGDSRSRRR